MDDPWGSPWADEIQHEEPARAKDESKVTPGTPVGVLPLEDKAGVKSPWDEEDGGFGDWAADSGNVQTSLRWNSHTENGWGTKETPKESKSSEGLNGLLPSWDDRSDNALEIPSNLVAPAATIARQPSPDPWATAAPSEITLNNEEQGKSTFDAPLGETKYKYGVADDVLEELPKFQWHTESTRGDASEPLQLGDSREKTLETETPKIKTRERNLSHVLVGHDLAEVSSQANDPDSGIALDDSVAEGHRDIGSIKDSKHYSGDRPVDQASSSRPSSSPSERSHHDEQPLPESPRTSLDEEQGRPQMERKASSKVQELVHHFDDIIAKQNEVVEPISRTPQKPDRENIDVNQPKEDTQDEDDFGDDFGDFEEGMSDAAEETAEKLPFDGSPVETSEGAKPDFGPVTFEVKTSMVSALFLGLEPDSSAEKVFIPDTQIHDCFNSVEQRKTWYRISRYGSMRKHNTGNDDNYKRISWRKSEVRVDTLKIVGRWMEEDRLSGRVVLGGASKGSSIFGWNDAAQAPVPISSALAAKRNKKKSQDTVENFPEVPREWPKISSRHSSPKDHERRRSSGKAISLPAATKVEPPAVANFGWNTPSSGDVAIKPPAQVQEKPAQRPKPSTRSDSPKSSPPQRSASTSQSPISKKAHKPKEAPLQPHVKPKEINEPLSIPSSSTVPSSQIKPRTQPPAPGLITKPAPIDEDDEWGEMVSSPIVTPVPSFPVPQLRHKRSRSFNGASSTAPQNKSIIEPQKRSFEIDHRPRASLDSILTPQAVSRGPSNGVLLTAPLSSNSQNTSKHDTPPTNKATSNTSSSDPWASADFSFFDSAPAPAPTSILANLPTSPPKQPMIPAKTVSFAGNPVPTTKPPVSERKEHRTRDELEQDRIVRSIVHALPDLSYMLR